MASFEDGRAAVGVVARGEFALVGQRSRQFGDGAAVFGVGEDQGAAACRPVEQPEDGPVRDHQRVGVGRVDLEGGDPGVEHRVELGKGLGPLVDEAHVQAVVDAGLAARQSLPGVERAEEAVAARGGDEVDDARRAAKGRRPGAALKVVARPGGADRQVEVGVRVDAAGHDEKSRGVDDGVRRLSPQVMADVADLLAVDAQVGAETL